MKREKTMRTKKNSLLWVEEIFPLVGEKIIPYLGEKKYPLWVEYSQLWVSITPVLSLDLYSLQH